MFRVNKLLLTKVIYRSIISFTLVLIAFIFTGKIGDAVGYIGLYKFQFSISGREQLTSIIFSFLSTFESIYIPFLIGIFISSLLLFLLVNKYIYKRNSQYWYLLIYLPCLLIYASVPSKEYLVFISGLTYINIEIEDLIRAKDRKNSPLIINISKISLLTFIIILRGVLIAPYLFFASIVFLYKHFNLKTIKLNKVNVLILIFYSFLISLFITTIVILRDPGILISSTNYLNKNFTQTATFSRNFNIDLVVNLYNPLYFLKLQFLSFFPSFKQIINKPYVLLIVIDSLIFLYLYIKLWSNLFLTIRNDNLAKNIFAITFVSITCSYFLLYGIVGYVNIGSSQRFRTNFIPISLFLPLIANEIILKNKLKVNYPHK